MDGHNLDGERIIVEPAGKVNSFLLCRAYGIFNALLTKDLSTLLILNYQFEILV